MSDNTKLKQYNAPLMNESLFAYGWNLDNERFYCVNLFSRKRLSGHGFVAGSMAHIEWTFPQEFGVSQRGDTVFVKCLRWLIQGMPAQLCAAVELHSDEDWFLVTSDAINCEVVTHNVIIESKIAFHSLPIVEGFVEEYLSLDGFEDNEVATSLDLSAELFEMQFEVGDVYGVRFGLGVGAIRILEKISTVQMRATLCLIKTPDQGSAAGSEHIYARAFVENQLVDRLAFRIVRYCT
jgi:hypothetical protein